MPDPALPNLRRVVCSGQMSQVERWSNTFHFIDLVPLTQSRADSLRTIPQELYVNLIDRLTPQWTWDTCTVQDKSEEDGPIYDVAFEEMTGSAAGSAFQQIAVVITWGTGVPGRRRRGRTYLAGLSNSQFDEDPSEVLKVEAGTVAEAILDAADAMHARSLIEGAAFVVYSRVGAGQTTAIDRARVGLVPDTQRRRRGDVPEEYVSRSFP